ncbi:Smr/MutS family protein [Treponema pallidum]|uniref:Smr/MutS family protein n=1 Tax=Treponema pallidum TaxID=160 RepID=UPI000BA5BB31|nr:Smr/MutS family protein [Treponema pallidum]
MRPLMAGKRRKDILPLEEALRAQSAFARTLRTWEGARRAAVRSATVRARRRGALPSSQAAAAPPVSLMEVALARYGLFDKDAAGACAEYARQRRTFSIHSRRGRRKLRTAVPEARLDLHGMTCSEARSALDSFFAQARERLLQKVEIVHGKGHHSKGGSVLAPSVKRYVQAHPHAGELFHPAERRGGKGTTWVLLKRSVPLH